MQSKYPETVAFLVNCVLSLTSLQAKLLQKLNFRFSLDTKGQTKKETEMENQRDNKRGETDIDTSLAWTARTQFHLSPPS